MNQVAAINPCMLHYGGLRAFLPDVWKLHKEAQPPLDDRHFGNHSHPQSPSLMKKSRSSPETQVLMAGCVATTQNSHSDWHSFPFDEFYLISGGATSVGIAGKKHKMGDNTLILIRQGEKRGYWNTYGDNPTFWAVFFKPEKNLYRQFPGFNDSDPMKRVWYLTPEQAAGFKSLIVKIATEHSTPRTGSSIAEASWLRLLMVTVQRWAESGRAASVSPDMAEPDVLHLWQKLNEMVWQPADSKRQLHLDMPNYDSVRHRFQKTFGMSPQKLLMLMRMEQAKSMLLESSLTVKEIASRLGYVRQHEFTRAFHKMVGVSPSTWKSQFGAITSEKDPRDFNVP